MLPGVNDLVAFPPSLLARKLMMPPAERISLIPGHIAMRRSAKPRLLCTDASQTKLHHFIFAITLSNQGLF